MDKDTGIVYDVVVTPANTYDVTVVLGMLTCEEETVYGGSSYLGAEKRENAVTKNNHGKKIKYKTNLFIIDVYCAVMPKIKGGSQNEKS